MTTAEKKKKEEEKEDDATAAGAIVSTQTKVVRSELYVQDEGNIFCVQYGREGRRKLTHLLVELPWARK